MKVPQRSIQCELRPGLFDNEYLVLIGSGASVLVGADSVKVERAPTPDDAGSGAVLVYLIGQEGDSALIEVPGEPVVGGLRSWGPASAVHA